MKSLVDRGAWGNVIFEFEDVDFNDEEAQPLMDAAVHKKGLANSADLTKFELGVDVPLF